MDDAQADSITQWFHALQDNDQLAAERLWNRLFDNLVVVARRRLGTAKRRVADEEDVAISVFDTLVRGAAEGRFANLADRHELWKLLMRITSQKAVDQIRRECRQKRGSGQLRGDSVFSGGRNDGDSAGFDQVEGDEPTPEFLAALEDEHLRLLTLLRDETLRDVARLRLCGHTNAEIADRLDISARSVERKLQLVRDTWRKELLE